MHRADQDCHRRAGRVPLHFRRMSLISLVSVDDEFRLSTAYATKNALRISAAVDMSDQMENL